MLISLGKQAVLHSDPINSFSPREHFRTWLQGQPSPWFIGEVAILPGYDLRHRTDVERAEGDLAVLTDFAALRELIKYREDGEFRPVRGHRGLNRGWQMAGLSFPDLYQALEWIYPAALAIWAEVEAGRPVGTEFRETAARQTGMYRLTQTITDEQLEQTVAENCRVDCLRHRLWSPTQPRTSVQGEIPLLCPEACNYLIGKAREVIKSSRK